MIKYYYAFGRFLTNCKYKLQIIFRGYPDYAVYGLDDWIADCTKKPLRRLIENKPSGVPGDIADKHKGDIKAAGEEWDEILKKILWSVENKDKEPTLEGYKYRKAWYNAYSKHQKRQQEGFVLLGKHLSSLWD